MPWLPLGQELKISWIQQDTWNKEPFLKEKIAYL
jgi:hypothetical protein